MGKPITAVLIAFLVIVKVGQIAMWSYIAHHPDPAAEAACRPTLGKVWAVPSWSQCIRNHYHYPSWSEFSARLSD